MVGKLSLVYCAPSNAQRSFAFTETEAPKKATRRTGRTRKDSNTQDWAKHPRKDRTPKPNAKAGRPNNHVPDRHVNRGRTKKEKKAGGAARKRRRKQKRDSEKKN